MDVQNIHGLPELRALTFSLDDEDEDLTSGLLGWVEPVNDLGSTTKSWSCETKGGKKSKYTTVLLHSSLFSGWYQLKMVCKRKWQEFVFHCLKYVCTSKLHNSILTQPIPIDGFIWIINLLTTSKKEHVAFPIMKSQASPRVGSKPQMESIEHAVFN